MENIGSIDELRNVLLTAISKYDKIGLLTHKDPDGDGLSACLVLQELLQAKKKNVSIVLENRAPDNLDLLDAKPRTTQYIETLSFPLILIVDCQDRERLGICSPLVDKAELTIALDHHENNGSDEVDYLFNDPDFVSVGAIIYQTFKEEILSLPTSIKEYCATALYVTILNDTNNFVNSNTDAAVFHFAAELTLMGIKPYEITKTFMLTKPPNYFRFIGQTLATIRLYSEGKVLFFHSTLNMLTENDLHTDATSKVTNWVKKPLGVEIVVYFREIGEYRYRLSLRSESIDVNVIAQKYSGGGHKNAAGCEISGTLSEVEQSILKDIEKVLQTPDKQ